MPCRVKSFRQTNWCVSRKGPSRRVSGSLSSQITFIRGRVNIPSYFEQAAEKITEDQIAEAIVCGPEPRKHLAKIEEAEKAGADHIYFHQVGRDQEGFFRFYERQILPEFEVTSRLAA